jgi:hypothetical protein
MACGDAHRRNIGKSARSPMVGHLEGKIEPSE